jgi:hypothetical protein
MKTISLRDCEIVVINRPEDQKRHDAAVRLGEALQLSLRFVEAISCEPNWLGCALSHLKALRSWSYERPLLVLEDDVAAGPGYRDLFEVTDDADGLYLGVSRWGLVECFNWIACSDSVIAEDAPGGLMRVHNMLTCHAMIYVTRAWKEAVVEAIYRAIFEGYIPHDIEVAKIQSAFDVFAVRRPSFYQSAELQRPDRKIVAANTSVELESWELGTLLTVSEAERDRFAKLTRVDNRLTWVAA